MGLKLLLGSVAAVALAVYVSPTAGIVLELLLVVEMFLGSLVKTIFALWSGKTGR